LDEGEDDGAGQPVVQPGGPVLQQKLQRADLADDEGAEPGGDIDEHEEEENVGKAGSGGPADAEAGHLPAHKRIEQVGEQGGDAQRRHDGQQRQAERQEPGQHGDRRCPAHRLRPARVSHNP
jgi:hypothetical protein